MPEDEINIELDLDFDEIDRKVKAFTDRVFGDYNAFYRALSDDWKESRDLLAANDTPFARRTYLRSLSFFALVDGALSAERRIVREYLAEQENPPGWLGALTFAECVLLEEETFEIDDDGTVKARRRNFPPFKNHLRFTLQITGKYFYRKPGEVDYGGIGWQSFQIAHEIRNRITHPKNPDELLISDEELTNVKEAERWFEEALQASRSKPAA